MSNDASPQKRCCTCGETKPIDMFSKHKREKDGRQKRCKACAARHYAANAEAVCARVRAYQERNSEMIRAKKRAYQANNIEKRRAYNERNAERIREHRQDYREKNAETLRKKQRDYSAANPKARFKSQQNYYSTNAERILAKKRAEYAANPDKFIAIHHNRRARIESNGGTYTPEEIRIMRIAQAGICAYCCRQYDPDELTVDHIIPIAQGGRNDISNICLACDRCNKSKHAKTPEQWVNRWYLLKD